MATVDTSTLDVPAYTTYSDLDPTKQQENLAYINEQLWDFMQQAGFVLSDGQMDSAEKDAFQSLWTAQNDLIQQQSDYLDDVKSTFNAKAESLPTDFSFSDFLEEYGGSIAFYIVTYFFGPVAGQLAEFAVEMAGKGLEILDKLYTSGGGFCDKMKAENENLLNLPFSKENYQIRSSVISQHSLSIDNLLTHVLHAEEQVSQGFQSVPSSQESSVLQEISDTLKRIEAAEHIIQCPITGCHIYTKELLTETPG